MPNLTGHTILSKSIRNILIAVFSVIITLTWFSPIFDRGLHSLRTMIQARGNFDELRKSYHRLEASMEARNIIPPGFSVQVFPQMAGLVYVSVRYVLYPVLLKPNGPYLLDFTGQVENVGPVVNVHHLSSGGKIFVRPGFGLNQSPANEIPYPLGRLLGNFFLFSCFNMAAGSLVMRGVVGGWRNFPASWYWAVSYLLGFLIFTATLWLFLLAGGKLGAGEVAGIWGLLIILSALVFRKEASGPGLPFQPDSQLDIAGLTFKFLALLITISIFVPCVLTPVTNWDAMSHWLLKSKSFFFQQTLDLSYTHHNYYPVLWSLNIAAQYALAGGPFDELAQWTTATFFLIMLWQLKWTLRDLGASSKTVWSSLFLFLVVSLKLNILPAATIAKMSTFNAAIPENGLLAYLTGAISFICLWLRNPKEIRFLAFALVLAAGMVMMKLEGAVMAVFLGIAILLTGLRNPWLKPALPWIIGFCCLIIIPLVWRMWLKSHGYLDPFYHGRSALTLEKLIFIGKWMLTRSQLNLLWYISALFALSLSFSRAKPWNDREIFLAILSVLLILFAYVAILGWEKESVLTSGVEVIKRLFCHALSPLILLWASRMSSYVR